jgi:hypothetical protein
MALTGLKIKTSRNSAQKDKKQNELRGTQMQKLATDCVPYLPFSRLNVPFSKIFTGLLWRVLIRSKYNSVENRNKLTL